MKLVSCFVSLFAAVIVNRSLFFKFKKNVYLCLRKAGDSFVILSLNKDRCPHFITLKIRRTAFYIRYTFVLLKYFS